MDLNLTDGQLALLLTELDRLIENDRYPLSPRIRALREIRAMLRPYPERPPPSPRQKTYEPPSRGQYRRRLSIGAQKGPRIGVQKGPPAATVTVVGVGRRAGAEPQA